MKSVVICGSRRFKSEMRAFAGKLRNLGVVVYEPYLFAAEKGEWESLPDKVKGFVALGLTHDHFYKIQMADVIYVYNKGGYSGVSTTMELGYAVAVGKPIYAFSDEDPEWVRRSLFREIIKTPQELLKRLK